MRYRRTNRRPTKFAPSPYLHAWQLHVQEKELVNPYQHNTPQHDQFEQGRADAIAGRPFELPEDTWYFYR